ncbi:MAG: O-antigen ligase family protein [Acidobacteriota bacterium]|nr:O-antigen ligase family protein [Acidobacteriota bacterium]
MSLARRLGLPDETARTVALAVLFYLGHLFCAGWAASSELFAFATLVTVAYALYRRLLVPSFHILYFPLALYGLDSTISAFVAERRIHTFGENALWGKMLLFPAALILFRSVPRSRDAALRMLLIFGVFSASYGFVQYFALGGNRDLEHRITGPSAHVMTLSGLLLPIALTFLVLWVYDVRNILLLIGAAMTHFALLITFTRSAWLGWIVAVAVLLALKWPKALAWAVPVAVLAISFAPLPFFSRVISSFDIRQSSNLDRIRMAEAGIEIIKDYPVFGVGPANVKEVYPLYRKHDAPRFRIPHLHNNLIQLWAERGILALVAYLILQCLFLRECARAWGGPATKFAEVGVVVAVGLASAGLFEFNFGDTEVFWVMLDVFAMVIAFIERPELSNEPRAALVAADRP